jgi:hypothetical protein
MTKEGQFDSTGASFLAFFRFGHSHLLAPLLEYSIRTNAQTSPAINAFAREEDKGV